MAKEDKAEWHRLGGYVLSPLFKLMGYDTYVEIDLAEKRQLVDIIVVRRKQVAKVPLPEIYWQAFDQLNEHNLISFKSYSESFNAFALQEFFGHLANYQKIHKLPKKKVNLYVLSHHYPRKLLKPFEAFVTVVKKDEIFDLKLGDVHPVRFVIMRETDHPVLALFSGDMEKVKLSYAQLKGETQLLEDISIYLKKINEYYKEEIFPMQTQETYESKWEPPFVFPWEQEYHDRQMRKVKSESEKQLRKVKSESEKQLRKLKSESEAEGIRKGKLLSAQAMLKKGLDASFVSEITGLEEQLIVSLGGANKAPFS